MNGEPSTQHAMPRCIFTPQRCLRSRFKRTKIIFDFEDSAGRILPYVIMAAAVSEVALPATPTASTATPIQHTVFFKFPDIDDEGNALLQSIVSTKFCSMPGIWAQFYSYGEQIEGCAGRDDFMAKVDWPDKTNGFTHCLFVLASGPPALKSYLHSDFHLKDWIAGVKPFIKGIVVFDNELVPSHVELAKATIQHTVLFKFPDIIDEVPPELEDIVVKFNTVPGIVAGFRPYGAAGFTRAGLMSEVDWPDKTDGYTHCLFVLCDDAAALKVYLHSDFHKKVRIW